MNKAIMAMGAFVLYGCAQQEIETPSYEVVETADNRKIEVLMDMELRKDFIRRLPVDDTHYAHIWLEERYLGAQLFTPGDEYIEEVGHLTISREGEGYALQVTNGVTPEQARTMLTGLIDYAAEKRLGIDSTEATRLEGALEKILVD